MLVTVSILAGELALPGGISRGSFIRETLGARKLDNAKLREKKP